MPFHRLSARVFLTLVISVGLFLLAVDFLAISRWEQATLPEYSGTLGASFGPADFHNRVEIKTLSPDSPLLAAGAQNGDVIIFDRTTDILRILAKNEPIGLRLFHGGQERHLKLAASAANPNLSTVRFFFLDWASMVLCVLSGMLVAIRRPEPGPGPYRILCALLLINGTGTEWNLLPPGRLLDGFMLYGWGLSGFLVFQLFFLFALAIPESQPLLRNRWVRRLFFAQLSVHGLYVLCDLARTLQWAPAASMNLEFLQSFGMWQIHGCIYGGFAALCFSLWRNTGLARQQMLWATLSLGILYLSFGAYDFLLAMEQSRIAGILMDLIGLARCGAVILLVYALLSRRMLDVGLAINRTLAMAVISSFLLILFAITEFAVDKLLHFHGRETSIFIDAAVALAVILSFHRIQHWVNHYINHIFFHHWEVAAQAFRRFMASAPHITDGELLQEKFIAAVVRFANVERVAIYQQRDGKTFSLCHASVLGLRATHGIDDDVIVALRHERMPLESEQQWLFPMMVRGGVCGMVLVGAKRDGHALRGDEIELLKQGVDQLSLDLVSIRASQTESRAAGIEHEHQVLSQRVADLERLCLAQEQEAAAWRQLAGQHG